MRTPVLVILWVISFGMVVVADAPITADNIPQLSMRQAFDTDLDSFDAYFLSDENIAVSAQSQFHVSNLVAQAPDVVEIANGDGRIVALSPDRRLLALYYSNREVEIWTTDPMAFHVSIGCLQGTSRTHGAFTADGRLFAVFNRWNEVDVWDLESMECLHELTGLRSNAFDLAFSPDGTLLAAGGGVSSRDDHGVSLICIWNVASGELAETLPTQAIGDNHAMAFTPDGAQLVSAGNFRMHAWETQSWERTYDSGSAYPGSYGMSLSPDGSLLAIASDTRTVLFYEVATMQRLRTVSAGASVQDVDFSPDGTKLAVACANGDVRIWTIP